MSADPSRLEHYWCYLTVARQRRDWETAEERLEALLDGSASEAGAKLVLATLRKDRGGHGVVPMLREAADLFSHQGHLAGEVQARVALAGSLARSNEVDAARAELARALDLVELESDPILWARVKLGEADLATVTDEYSTVSTLAREVAGKLPPDSPPEVRIQAFQLSGTAEWAQGRLEKAQSYYQQSVETARAAGDAWLEARELYSWAFVTAVLIGQKTDLKTAAKPLEKALESALRSGNLRAELGCRLALGQVEGADSVVHFDRALELARRLNDYSRWLRALRMLAYTLITDAPDRFEEAVGQLEEAIRLAKGRGDLLQLTEGRIGLVTQLWLFGKKERALAELFQVLDDLERFRALQDLDEIRARWIARYAFFYKRISGWLLESGGDGSQPATEDLQLAVDLIERQRARVLLDTLASNEVAPRTFEVRHGKLLRDIAASQRRLRDPDLSPPERSTVLLELERLETAESAWRVGKARTSAGASELPIPRVDLGELRQALEENEALLSFQLSDGATPGGPVSNGGSWLIVVTRQGEVVYRLPDLHLIEPALRLFLGLVARADGSEVEPAARLHEMLLGEALNELPPGIDHLVLVLDPAMEDLPLGLLRGRATEPVAGSFSLTRVPSMTVFVGQRRHAPTAFSRPVLALADPQTAGQRSGQATGDRNGLVDLGAGLASLPEARREGHSLVRRLGRGSRLCVDSEASESRLKSIDLSDFAVLHFGAHAVVDESRPGRSAVILAPGSEAEDGLLQMRDLAALDLADKLVVLAACRTAAGEVVTGEGTMGLARAFLQAGARTVVSSLWPLRDDLASAFFDRFYDGLARGADVRTAWRVAQLDLASAGLPPRAWAGIVVLGDGRLKPVAPASLPGRLPVLVLAALVAVISIRQAVRRPRRRT